MVLVKSVQVDIGVKGDAESKAKLDDIAKRAEALKKAFPEYKLKIDSAAAAERLRVFRAQLAEATRPRTAEVKVKVDDSALARFAARMKGAGGPAWLGPALLLAPAAASLGGVAAGAGIGLAGAFTAGAGALAAFGAVAKPVLADAKTAATAVETAQNAHALAVKKVTAQYQIAMSAAKTQAQRNAAYAAEQKGFQNAALTQQLAVNKAYAELSPAQIALSKQIGAMANAWQAVKAAQTPVVAGALQPWLKDVVGLTNKLAPIIAHVAPVIAGLGTQFGALISSPAFRGFRDFIASTGTATVSAAGSTLIDFVRGLMVLLPKFDPLIREAVGWIARLGPAFLTWANSQKTADRIQAFIQFFSRNGPVVGGLLKNIAGALKAMAPGLSAGGMLELQALSGFFGLVAKLPPSVAKPLFEIAGAMLLLNKLGVVSVGLKLIGMDAAKAAAGGGAVGMWGKMLPGVRLVGGALAAVVVVDMILKSTPNSGDTGVPGQKGNWFETPFNMPGPKSPKSAGNWLTSFAPYERALKDFGKFVVNEWNTIWSNTVSGAVQDWKRLTGVWDRGRHYLAGSFDATRHDIAHTADLLGRYLTASFDATRHDVAHIWDLSWQNTIGRAGRGVHDVAAWLNSMRHSAANIFNGVRGDIASAWNAIWANTASRVASGVGTVVSWFRGLPGKVLGALASLGFSLYGVGSRALSLLLAGAKSAVGGITSFFSGFAHGIVSVFKKIWGWFSPSSVMYEGGKSLMQGLAGGIKDHAHLAQAQAAKAARMAAFSAAGPSSMTTGGVMRWSPLVKQALAMEGLGAYLASQVEYQMMTESGGNPNAINLTDINAQHGDPSRGLLQVIMSTFKAFHWPGTSWNIYDPLANIAAAINYARHTYGPTLMSGGTGMGSGHGYWTGTSSASPGWAWVGERGPELVKFRGGEQVAPVYGGHRGGGGNTYNITITLPPGSDQQQGRRIVGYIMSYEKGSGKGWRS